MHIFSSYIYIVIQNPPKKLTFIFSPKKPFIGLSHKHNPQRALQKYLIKKYNHNQMDVNMSIIS
jgi:hypothetical protein